MHFLLPILIFSLASCSRTPPKKKYTHGEYIIRHKDEYFFSLPPPIPLTHPPYPWENKFINGVPRITKEFFRCKGNPLNPLIVQKRVDKESLRFCDCLGKRDHGLPLRGGQEFIYPCLIDLLNYVQEKTENRVVITCGHRCPKHNMYADATSYNWNSKHMLGAEVDFYVENFENRPETIIEIIKSYYPHFFSEQPEYCNFVRYEKKDLNVATPPWYNKEIFIKLYQKDEGRDLDNQHPFPYLSIQVRFDRESQAKVPFDPKQAQNYLRH